MDISRKPIIQFKPNGVELVSCTRKILFISPLKELIYKNKTIYYCNVYTQQEHFQNGEPIIDRTNERMVAFGACAKYLQSVNYKTHTIGLSWFTNCRYQNVIYAFREYDNEYWIWQDAGYLPSVVSLYEQPILKPYANCEKEEFSGFTYYGCKIYKDGNRLGCWMPHKCSKKEIINEALKLEPDQCFQFAIISNYGNYKVYNYQVVRYNNKELINKILPE